jgi:ribulose-phosphate 3-epimerase
MDTTVKIIPAIMPNDFEDLGSKVNLVRHSVEWVQIDVMDGKYTGSYSWPYGVRWKHFAEIMNEDEGLPFWKDVDYELDLMVTEPYEEALKWAKTGVGRIILHWKTISSGDYEKLISEIKDAGVDVGIALLPSENFTEIESILDKIDFVQFMGIKKVGFQNQPFVPEILDNIKYFHSKYPEKIISVDGGVDISTAQELVDAGVTRLVSGSYVFEGSPEDNIKDLEDLLNQ